MREKYLLELSGDAMKYVTINDRLLGTLRMKWQDAEMWKLEYYIANVNPQCGAQYKVKMLERIQLHLTTPMSLALKEP